MAMGFSLAGLRSSQGLFAVGVAVVTVLVGTPLVAFVFPLLAPLAGCYFLFKWITKTEREAEAVVLSVADTKAKTLAETKERRAKLERESSKASPSLPKPEEPSSRPKTKTTEKKPVAPVASSAPTAGGPALLRRLREQKEKQRREAKTEPEKKILVAYASQTGTAQEIAKALHAQLVLHTSKKALVLAAFNDVDIDTLKPEKFPIVAFVAASTGDGDPPDNTASFYAKMLRKSGRELQGVKFTCLGLGDSNYTRFMAVPRNMRKKFTGLGAETLYWNAEADEVDGLEETVDKWTEGAVKAILKEYNAATNNDNNEKKNESQTKQQQQSSESKYAGLPPLLPRTVQFTWEAEEGEKKSSNSRGEEEGKNKIKENGQYGPDEPFYAKISSAERVTPEDYEKQILHMEIDISGSNIEYKPGDAFGVLAENSPELVDTLLARLGVNNGNGASREFETSEQINSIKTPCSVRDAFMKYCDITSPPKKSLLRLLAESCKKEEDKVKLLEMISAKGKATYRKDILEGEPNLLDILETYPSCKPKLEDLIEFLPALAPRLYSVSSTREVHQDQVHFAFSLVEFKTSYKNKGNVRRGVATSWLCRMADLVQDGWTVHIPIFLKPSRDFQHPKVEDLTKPIIMIGPGTGVSPFRGFLHYRGFLEQQQQQETTTKSKAGESWLFYGCRDRTKDFLYEKDFTMLHEEKKVLHHYQTAFSREQSTKVYVQHLMENNKEKLGQLILEEGAYIFVCGDGMHMAKDVQNKLNEILCKQGKMTAIDADKMLKDMLKSGRYVRDIWS